jgi:transposase
MKVSDLLKFIPEEELAFLATETKADYQVKKLTGSVLFKLLLFSSLNSNRPSLRVIESFFHTGAFKTLADIDETTRYNSIRDRICSINPLFFEKIFHSVFEKFSGHFQENHALLRFDSTMVAVSSLLIDWGMRVGPKTRTNKRQIKYTVGMKGSFPCQVKIFGTQQGLNEDKTIPPAIFNYPKSNESIVVFDRGVQSKTTYDLLTDEDIHFVTRLRLNAAYTVTGTNPLEPKPEGSSVTVTEDCWVILGGRKNKKSKKPLRVIKAVSDETNQDIYFLTNIKEATAYSIAAIYKRRWEIEVFFKFLKQELDLSQLVCRHPNGIQVMIYMKLIVAILLIAYKKLNKITGYKMAKLYFCNELESALIREIVVMCGGDPGKAPHLFNDT